MTINRKQFFQVIVSAIAGIVGVKKAAAGVPFTGPLRNYRTFTGPLKVDNVRVMTSIGIPPTEITLFNPSAFEKVSKHAIAKVESYEDDAFYGNENTISLSTPSGGSSDWVKPPPDLCRG